MRIEARLHSLEQGSSMPAYEVVLKAVKPIIGVSLHLAMADLTRQGHWVDVLSAVLKDYRVKAIDHLIVLHAESEDEYTPISVEIVAPVEKRDVSILISRSEGRLTRCELPAFPRMASTIHHGTPALVMPAYQAVGTWMENNAYTIV